MQIGVRTTFGVRHVASGMRQLPGMRFDMEIAVMYRPADTGPLAGGPAILLSGEGTRRWRSRSRLGRRSECDDTEG